MNGKEEKDKNLSHQENYPLPREGHGIEPEIASSLLKAIDTGSNTVLLTDADGIIIYANQAMQNRCDCGPEDFIGQPMTSLWFQPNEITRDIMTEVTEKKSWHGRIQHKTKSGASFQESCTISQVPGESGNATRLIKTGRLLDDEGIAADSDSAVDMKYKSILDLMNDGYVEIDLKGNITFLNKRAAEIYQRSHSEMIGLNYIEYMTPEEAEKTSRIFTEIYEIGKSDQIIEYEVAGKDGKPIFCETFTRLLYDHRNNPVGFGGVIRDVTERKILARQLKANEESYRRVMELAPDAITITRVSDGKYFEINEAFSQQTGWPREEVIGRTVEELGLYRNPKDRERIVLALKTEGQVSGVRINFRHRDGSMIYSIVSARTIHFKGEECILFLATPINSLVAAQNALKESEKRYRSILGAAPDAICLTRLDDGKYIEANDMFYKQTGFTPQETIGRTSIDLNIYAEISDRDKFISAIRKKRYVDNMEVLTRFKDGTLSHQIWSGRILDWNGEECLLVVAKSIDDQKKIQQLLHEREESYRTILNTAPYSIVILRRSTGAYVLVNDAFCISTGYSREDVIGRTPEEMNIFADPDQRARMYEILKRDKKIFSLEVNFRRKSGEIREFLISVSPIIHMGERCFLTITTNISAQKKAQRDLEKSEKTYRTIIESAPYSIDIVSYPDLRYVTVNNTFCKNTGYTKEEVIGRNAYEIGMFKDPKQVEYLVEELKQNGKVEGMELHCLSKDGHDLNTLCHIAPIQYMGKKCYLSSNVDLTQLRKMQYALRESEARFRAIFETAADAIFLKDKDLKYTLVNPAMEKLYKMDSKVFLGRTDEEVFGGQISSGSQVSEKNVLQGKIFKEEFKIKGKTDQTFHTIKVPVMGKTGEINGICGFVRDITSIKQLESQLLQAQKMEAVGTLAGGISHDFNNLLQPIISYSQILMNREGKDSPNYSKLKTIEQAGQRASELVSQLLAFSRKVEIHPRPLDLNYLIREVEKLLRRTIPKMIDIELDLADPVHTVNADPGQIEQVLLNIGVNARDAMPDGGRLTFSTANIHWEKARHKAYLDSRAPEYVMLSVADTGQGMTNDILERIFEPFYTTKGTAKGTGLGLAMVYGIVQNHGGRIFCESRPGQGTVFRVYFPAIDLKTSEKEETEKEIPIKKGSGEAVLYVDDEAYLRELAEEFLTMSGYHVITAEDGETALSLYKREADSISFIILDLIMPGMGGRNCLQEILKINPKAKVIICSGHSPSDPETDEVLMKARAFLKKPYDFTTLLQIIQE